MTAIEKYNARVGKANSLVCVGLDSDVSESQFEFNKRIIEQTHEYVSAYKLNTAFYEARGEQGMRELKMTMDYLQSTHPDIFTICDAKRGDIANTNKQYAKAYFELFGFDAITLHPYMGKESLMPFFEYREKVSIILCHTSNPGAKEFQEKQVEGNPFWQVIVQKVVEEWNDYSNCMLFMGATYPEELKKARELARNITFLVAGVDTQGGKAKEVIEAGLDVNKRGLIVNSSRGIIFSENPGQTARQLRDEINLWRTQ